MDDYSENYSEEYTDDYSIESFIRKNCQKPEEDEIFQLENDSLLRVNLYGQQVWIKKGSMVAYNGKVHMSRESLFRQGFRLFKKSVSKQDVEMTKANGMGELFIADQGKKITLLRLEDEPLFVHNSHLLAFEQGVRWDIEMTKSMTSAMIGGLFHVRLDGEGMAAITTRLKPLVLEVTEDNPVYTDPQNTVAWSGNVYPEIKIDASLGTLIGRSTGDTVQMRFRGNGFVVVQAFEELNMHR